MSKRFAAVAIVLSMLVSFLIGLMLAGEFTPAPVIAISPAAAGATPAVRRTSPVAGPSVVNFADVAARINTAVVNIDATVKSGNGWDNARSPRRDSDALPDGRPDADAPRRGSGSGFIIDPNGFILTNNHVIESAERIAVTLADGRVFRGDVVGTDPAIDVALLRIAGAERLPSAPLGNSDDLRVGEWVCAIGNPLGYRHSVTVGVVSFVGRKLFDQSLDDYIQTDAAINFGNSGGPLINARGEVIGINSAISSRASNIGFALPINQAVVNLEQLKTTGRVSRGFMGVTLTDVTPGLQQALSLPVADGAMVQDVTPHSPAERAGLRAYDIIAEVDGHAVVTNQELIRAVSARRPGMIARLDVIRDGRRQTVAVKLAERPARSGEADGIGTRRQPGASAPAPEVPLGITVREIDRGLVGRVEIPSTVEGVVVSGVDPMGPAHPALRRGMVILEVNRKPVRTVAEYQRLVAGSRSGDVLAFYCYDPTLGQRALITVTVN
jgi:serine protease Do